MLAVDRNRATLRASIRAILGFASVSIVGVAAQAQQAAPTEGALEEVIVTGFRESLNLALTDKRDAIGAVDSIRAEDIADFPDLNLAESIQRIPGVAIARDAGEGRQISVRGLSPEFTRVRLNGIEAMSANGGTDAAGGTNRTRGFDFNTFASELFNSITVHKSAAADLEEGSLGATVDLRTARPFDYDGLQFVVSGQGQYNDLIEDVSPRASMLLSNTWGDGTFGALVSVAYTDRKLIDEGSSTVRWGQASANGNFAPASNGAGGYTLAQLNSAFVPRIPRYDYYEHEQDRLGITASLQFAPNDRFSLNLDTAYAEFNATRSEIFLEIPNFSAAANGITVQDAVIDANNTLVYGVFNNVDIRSEQRFDELSTEFKQATLDGSFAITDTLTATALVGYSEANHENPKQTTLLFDWLGFPQVTYDYRGNSRLPLISYTGGDLTSSAQGVRPPAGSPQTYQSNGWYLSQVRLRPQTTDNEFQVGQMQLEWEASDAIKLKGGGQYKKFTFETTELRRSNGTTANQEATIPGSIAGIPISQYATTFNLGRGFNAPAGTNMSFLVPDMSVAADLLDLYNPAAWPMGAEPSLANNRDVEEEDLGAFVQLDWNTQVFDRTLRGNIGVRYVETTQNSNGYSFIAGAPVYVEAERTYDNTLPSLNLAYNVTDEFIVRASAAKVMSRPGLNGINPGGTVTVSGSSRAATLGNPNLDPTLAKAYDLGFEWYFADESLLGLALFYKDVGSRPTGTSVTAPFTGNPFGLPDSVAIAACGATAGCSPSADWTFNTTVNGDGGWLRGFEFSYQQPFTFLPGAFANFGTILNYTYTDSEFEYPVAVSVDPRGYLLDQLDGLSKTSWNATLYYEVERFTARISAAYRDEFITRLPGQNGNSVEGTLETLTLDASARFSVTDNLDLTLELLNLTDEFQDQYVDVSNRPNFYHHTGRNYILGARYKF
ncbi:TonB-dependent receptor [Povalibacter sp.]|uniref:TonB-dependent receptor n=1 Tax=Povalibacter sp. TaxID=1962978 RepID=UPI002F40EB60